MDTQALLNKTQEVMSPFETENVIRFATNLSVKSIMENPWIIAILLIVFFYAVVKKSKFVLASLFGIVSIVLLIRFTLSGQEGSELTLSSTLPFAFGALLIGSALIYFLFIKSE